jgi:lysosomal Pro-X carboxypeptidase
VQKDAPIFFFPGCESSIDTVPDNQGFLYDLAPEFGAAIVFAEHRYYGKTLPFGNESFSSLSNLGLLSSEQALADYVILIDYLKANRLPNATRSPVIAFGGSYCGDLTAYMRIKAIF